MSKRITPAMEKLQKQQSRRPRKSGPWYEAWYRLRRNKIAMVGMFIVLLLVILALFPDVFARYGEDEQVFEDAFTFPCWEHPMGTDNYGRDILSRVIYGARTSLLIGALSVAMSVVFGGTCGLVAAFYGNKVDNVIMRVMDVFYALPSFLLAIAIASALGSGLFNLAIAIAISQVPGYARVVRAAALTVRNQEYMEAIRAIGGSSARQMFRHMLPNAIAPIIVQATLGMANAIISGAALSFVGVGVQPPTAEWGFMLNAGRQYIREYWYIVTFPGLMIMVTILGLNLFGDGLRDAMDPKLKR